MKYSLVDDNDTDRMLLEAFAQQHPQLHLQGSFANPLEAISSINNHPPDLLFLDIEMPLLNGIDFLRSLSHPPVCVFISSHPEFAIDAFELFALDYILKPLTQQRFDSTVGRARAYLDIKEKADKYEHHIEEDSIVISEGYATHRIQISDILYLEALKDYTRIFTVTKNYVTLGNLSHSLLNLNIPQFRRVHRSYAVNARHIKSISDNNIIIHKKEIPIGKTYRNIISDLKK